MRLRLWSGNPQCNHPLSTVFPIPSTSTPSSGLSLASQDTAIAPPAKRQPTAPPPPPQWPKTMMRATLMKFCMQQLSLPAWHRVKAVPLQRAHHQQVHPQQRHHQYNSKHPLYRNRWPGRASSLERKQNELQNLRRAF